MANTETKTTDFKKLKNDELALLAQVNKIEIGGFIFFERKEPVYNSIILGVQVKYIAAAFAAYQVLKKLK
jgi:hypothetical protein